MSDETLNCAVACLIYNRDKTSVCLIKRRDVPVWVLPGGGIDPNEAPENAACREAFEETGTEFELKRLVGIYLPENKLSRKTYLFELAAKDAVLSSPTEETLGACFFELNRLPPMPPPYKSWIEDGIKIPEGVINYSYVPGVTYLNFVKLLILHPIKVLRFLLSRLGWHYNS
jgi:8-oxo-dGTP diphosphatase